MPCMFMCDTGQRGVCACGNAGAALGVHRHTMRVQSEGRGRSYGRSGRLAVVG
jgi:hypothetical protein